MEVPIEIGGGKRHPFDLATSERDIVAKCKAFKFIAGGSTPSANITALREAAMYLRSIRGSVTRVLIAKRDPHPISGETLGCYFVRLNSHHLEQVTVLEMPESGGELECIHGDFDPAQFGAQQNIASGV